MSVAAKTQTSVNDWVDDVIVVPRGNTVLGDASPNKQIGALDMSCAHKSVVSAVGCSTGVMLSYFLVRQTSRAVQFCTHCKRCSVVCGRPYGSESAYSWRVPGFVRISDA